jgi:hypothetical protein
MEILQDSGSGTFSKYIGTELAIVNNASLVLEPQANIHRQFKIVATTIGNQKGQQLTKIDYCGYEQVAVSGTEQSFFFDSQNITEISKPVELMNLFTSSDDQCMVTEYLLMEKDTTTGMFVNHTG